MSRENSLTVVVDSSGSMREMGKIMVARNIVAYIREYLRFHFDCGPMSEMRLLTWGPDTSQIDLEKDVDLPPIEPVGEGHVQPLLQALDGTVAANCIGRILLISDGHLSKTELAAFLAWRRDAPPRPLRAIAIGVDANTATLTKIAGTHGVFSAEHVASALHPWPRHNPVPLPDSLDGMKWSGSKKGV